MTNQSPIPFTDFTVNFAVYGGPGWGGAPYQVSDISEKLEDLIGSGQTLITFNNSTFGDFSPNVRKGFGVSVTINGTDYLYAGSEGDVVDFTRPPINPVDMNFLLIRDLNVAVIEGGWPPAGVPNLFTGASLRVENTSVTVFPPNAATSSWISVDFYASRSNSLTQPVDELFWIGDQGVYVGHLPALHGEMPVNIAQYTNGLWDIGRGWLGNQQLAQAGDYYIYAQVRDPLGRIMLSSGSFSSGTVYVNPNR